MALWRKRGAEERLCKIVVRLKAILVRTRNFRGAPMADHSLFVFVRVQGATPEAVGNALKDGSDKILDIYSIMGEWDLLVRIEHPDLNEIQRVVAEAIRAN